MTRREVIFTRVIRSRGIAMLISLAAIFMTVQAYALGKIAALDDFRTIAFPTSGDWFANGWLSMWVNIAVVCGVGMLMLLINRNFNLLRTSSVFFVAFFMLTMGCVPSVMGQFSASSLLALFSMAGVWIMFSIYNVRPSSRRVFLVFFMLGLGQLVEYTFMLYIPIFVAALGQMKIFSVKKILAAIIGNVTPAWIVWGLGLVPRPEIPHFEFTPPVLLLENPQNWPLLSTVALSLVTGFLLGCFNLIKIMGFNAQARAYNGLILLLSISTGIFAIVNFTNVAFYVTLLNACVAFQVGHFFRLTVMKRGYIVASVLMVAYIALYTWTMLT
ncbi:MAG: hypothetical protein NC411_02530 [Bacteroides sp.]|nr:hypothetical protein [Bacteroides sp.]